MHKWQSIVTQDFDLGMKLKQDQISQVVAFLCRQGIFQAILLNQNLPQGLFPKINTKKNQYYLSFNGS